jgi:prepilin-type N-terminal cleavage/methylation domain-containing protein
MNRRDTFRRRPVATSHTGNGFSLIEILVVLVLLLIGILATLRLFPGGFLTIVRTGEMTAAQALVDQQSNSYHNLISIPQAYLPGLPNNNGDIFAIPGIQPNDLTDISAVTLAQIYSQYNITPLANYSPYYFSNINKLRYVIGETLRLPIASAATLSAVGGTIYTLQAGPVFNIFHQDATTNDNADSLNVHGQIMTAVAENSANPAVVADGTTYAIDYANNMIAFFPRPNNNPALTPPINHGAAYRLFRFTALVYLPDLNNAGSFITQSTNFKITVNDQTPTETTAPFAQMAPQWVGLPLMDANGNNISSTAHVWPGTDQVTRQYRLVTQSTGANPTFSNDPFEYAWYSNQISTANANMGTLIFNPRGHITNPATNTDPQPGPNDNAYLSYVDNLADSANLASNSGLTAYIDYLTFDNHVIRDDRSVPNSSPFVIRLSLPYISTTGDLLADQSNYDGLFTESSSTATPDLIVYNMATGNIVSEISAGVSTAGNGMIVSTLDPKTGTLTLGDPTVTPLGQDVVNAGLVSANLRVLYRTQKEYGMQVQQATYVYQPVPSATNLDYKSFYLGSAANGGQTRRIYFDVSQAGKTINIGEYFTGPTTTPTDRHTNATYQIQDNAADYESINGKLYTYIDLGSALNSTATGRAIDNVQGASLKSRVAWIGSVDTTKDAGGNPVVLKRWRKVDNDTVLQITNQ